MLQSVTIVSEGACNSAWLVNASVSGSAELIVAESVLNSLHIPAVNTEQLRLLGLQRATQCICVCTWYYVCYIKSTKTVFQIRVSLLFHLICQANQLSMAHELDMSTLQDFAQCLNLMHGNIWQLVHISHCSLGQFCEGLSND